MAQNLTQSVALLDVPATTIRGGLMAKRRSAFVGVFAALVGGMASADVASAHYLTQDVARQSAQRYVNAKVADARTPYTFGKAVCDVDSQAVPHIRGCTLYYDTPATRPTTRWACAERIQVFYQPHNAGDPPPNYDRYIKDWGFTHPC